MFNSIYKGKKVLITGHTGFKGSWLSLWLIKLGAEVIGYSKDIPTEPSHIDLLKLNMTSLTGNILDKDNLLKTIELYKPDIIFHMAAQALVRESYVTPSETFETNIMGTINVLESCRKLGTVKAMVNVTSDKCYRNNDDGRAYTEDDCMGGNDPYSASKGSAELVSHAYRKAFFNPKQFGTQHSTLIANVRAGNVIGGGDWAADRLIPDMMRATQKGESVLVRNPRATRPWQHVLEPLSGYLLVGSKLLAGECDFAQDWNFGPQDEAAIPVSQVIENSIQEWDQIHYEIKEDPANVHESTYLQIDSSKAREKLLWNNVWNSAMTFKKTIHWYKQFYMNNEIISASDLDDYINDATQADISWTNL